MSNYHTTINGEKIAMVDLGDTHLLNIIALQRKAAVRGVKVHQGGSGWDVGEMWYEEHTAYGDEALAALGHSRYTAERDRRGL